jgi:hypothetical protein
MSVSIPLYLNNVNCIRRNSSTLLKYEDGINNVEEFKEAFMVSNKNSPGLNIGGSVGQLNWADGKATITATQFNSSTMTEYQKLVEDLLQQVPADTSSETKNQINEGVNAITEEFSKPQPKQFPIKAILKSMTGLVNTAGFASSLITFGDFFVRLFA